MLGWLKLYINPILGLFLFHSTRYIKKAKISIYHWLDVEGTYATFVDLKGIYTNI